MLGNVVFISKAHFNTSCLRVVRPPVCLSTTQPVSQSSVNYVSYSVSQSAASQSVSPSVSQSTLSVDYEQSLFFLSPSAEQNAQSTLSVNQLVNFVRQSVS